jgi:hypothetical protein
VLGGVVPFAPPAAAAARTESMNHYSCDRAAKASVSVTWTSKTTAKVKWKLTDSRRDGRNPALRIVGLDHNGAKASLKRNFFSDDGVAYVTKGVGNSKSGTHTFKPGLKKLDEVEVWIWTSAGGRKSSCGYNITKRINDTLHTPARTTPLTYAKSKTVRDRVVAEAWKQYRNGYHESGVNCAKYTNAFQSPDICQAWCANFAWWIWMTAGVKDAKLYNSSYTDDFQDEWRVKFKTTGGPHKPAKGDVIVWSHRTDGVNGHNGVVVQTDGWNVKIIQGNWGDRVALSGWINPFTSRQDGGAKRVIGFASPA